MFLFSPEGPILIYLLIYNEAEVMEMYSCINLHFTDFCNFHCKHCFVKKENCELSFDELKVAVDKIYKYLR